MKQIPLSKNGKNKGKYFALIDDEDFDRVSQYNWSYVKIKNREYAKRFDTKNKKIIYLHRFILNCIDGKIIDHPDGNGLNCQKYNLRFCTHRENMRNSISHICKYKGIARYKTGKFGAQIKYENKRRYLGTFNTEIEAAKAYDLEAVRVYGDFACLNFQLEK